MSPFGMSFGPLAFPGGEHMKEGFWVVAGMQRNCQGLPATGSEIMVDWTVRDSWLLMEDPEMLALRSGPKTSPNVGERLLAHSFRGESCGCVIRALPAGVNSIRIAVSPG